MNKKKTGSYFTPKPIADFMVKYIFNQIKDTNISVLEPSVGDGVFLESMSETNFINSSKNSLTLVEINNHELRKARKKIIQGSCNIFVNNMDFLEFSQKNDTRYSLIIGNPPYIKKILLSKKSIQLCESLHKESGLSKKKINNIWTSFVVGCVNLLDKNGILAFILPADILQVKYAEEIRSFLEQKFNRIEIFTLETSDFPNIEQQTVILIAYKTKKIKGTYFYRVKDLKERTIEQISSNGLMISQKKWTHYNLSFSDIKLLNRITSKMPKVSDFVNVSAGIVTGANKFFIQPKSVIDKYDLKKFALPILSKSTLFQNGIVLSNKGFNNLINKDKAMFLVSIHKNEQLNSKHLEFIGLGEKDNLNTRYKCSLRSHWYSVPNISSPPKAIFFKRCHAYPKLIKNTANIYITDTGYKINPKENISVKSFIFSFYNIITLIYAELMGRKYGGGVLELTPNEMKDLPISYIDISDNQFNQLVKNIVYKNTLNVSYIINNRINNTTNNEMKQLQDIYKKLLKGRIK